MNQNSEYNNIYNQLLKILNKKKRIILATVVESKGSTPQKPGCSAIFGSRGLIAGTIGGGASEIAISNIARKTIRNKKSKLFQFQLNSQVPEGDLPICGGTMTVLLDACPEKSFEVFTEIESSLKNRIPGVLATSIKNIGTTKVEIVRTWITTGKIEQLEASTDQKILISAVLMMGEPGAPIFSKLENQGAITYLEHIKPPPHLIIAGAGHIGKALSHLGKLLGFETTVWDDRAEYANAKNLPDTNHVFSCPLDEFIDKTQVKNDCWIVIVTRGHKYDIEFLRKVIGSKARYIGMIGSRRKIAQVRDMFLSNGWANEAMWNKIHSPVGLDIGAQTVHEIAVSIAAQLVQVKNNNR